jgi:hypothetical protein
MTTYTYLKEQISLVSSLVVDRREQGLLHISHLRTATCIVAPSKGLGLLHTMYLLSECTTWVKYHSKLG